MEFTKEELNLPYAKICSQDVNFPLGQEDMDGVIGDLILSDELRHAYIKELIEEKTFSMGPCCQTYYLVLGEYQYKPIFKV